MMSCFSFFFFYIILFFIIIIICFIIIITIKQDRFDEICIDEIKNSKMCLYMYIYKKFTCMYIYIYHMFYSVNFSKLT